VQINDFCPSSIVLVMSPSDVGSLELSVVMPCLNESDTVAACVRKAWQALNDAGLAGEVIVADNGSTDGSQRLAAEQGAIVVPVADKGYGHALMGGIAAAKGRFILMGDADDSYDFLEIPKFIVKLREGHDLVQGCRLPAGGGTVAPGAMPWSHRWIGNPMFSFLSRQWFRAPIHDVYCGMRGFTKAHYDSLQQRCTGMEFATEMIIKSSLRGARIVEVPITLHPDGRKAHPPHLRTLRDGWRTLRFFLMFSPRWLFLMPGLAMIGAGLFCYALALPAVSWRGIMFDVHTLLYGSAAILVGYQAVLFAIFTKTFAMNEGLLPQDPRMAHFFRVVNLERGVGAGLVCVLAGLGMMIHVFMTWRGQGFGRLDYAQTLRWAIPGGTFFSLGVQTILSGFFVSILGLGRK
jgi:glycosyltransferase involved in cell wall biosynthesis